MEKIININISGRIIPIDESTYEKLKEYIESLRRHFKNEEGSAEIINDIESRIAELLNGKITKGAAAIVNSDIEEVIASMGKPQELDEILEGEPANTKTEFKSEPTNKRLYRNLNDKMLGGVCSGIANYFNIDPTILRVVFAILFFSGWVLVIYIVCWIVLPKSYQEPYLGNRVYRDPKQTILGGVASGLAAYFKMQVWAVRLIFLAPFLFQLFSSWLSGGIIPNMFPGLIFTSLSGTFAMAYIILWIVLPKANSEYQKMEMRGEKVDVNKIRENVKEKAKEMGGEFKSAAQNIGEKAKEFSQTQGKTFFSEFMHVVKTILGGLFRILGVLIKIFLFFIVGIIVFALLLAFISIVFGGVMFWPVNNFIWASGWQQANAFGVLILFLLVPVVSLLIWLVRLVFNIKSKKNYLGWVFGILWTLGWVAVVLFSASVFKEIRYYEHEAVEIPVTKPVLDKLTVSISEPTVKFNKSFWWMDNDVNGWNISDDTLKLSVVQFNLLASPDSSYRIVLKKYSAGKTFNDAIDRAKKIQYSATINNNMLDLGSGFSIDKESKYRGQMVEVEIQIPVGKKIRFDESVWQKLSLPLVKLHRNYTGKNGKVEIEIVEYGDSFLSESAQEFMMGADGSLKNIDGSPIDKKIFHDINHNDVVENIEKEVAQLPVPVESPSFYY